MMQRLFVFQYQAPYGFSDAEGRYPGDRGATGAKVGGTNSSSRPYEANGPLKACWKAATSSTVRTRPKSDPRLSICSKVGRRTTMLHPILVFWKTNEKSHPRPEKAPNGINAAAIYGRVSLRCRTKLEGRHSDVIGCARTVSPCTCLRTKILCLSVTRLVNATPASFYARRSTNDAQYRLMIQGDRSTFLR